MTKQQCEILRKLREAREVVKNADQTEAKLVKAVFDAQLRTFAKVDPDFWTDKEYADRWTVSRERIGLALVSEGFITGENYHKLWAAFDTLATEDAMAYA